MYDKEKFNERIIAALEKYVHIKNILILLITLFFILILSNAIMGILLLILFIPLAKYTVRITRFIDYITLETYTASTIMMAFLFGPIVGALSGLIMGFYGYLSNSITKFKALTNVFVAGVTATIIGFLHLQSFNQAFILGIIINNMIAFIVFIFLDPDQVQNVTYRITHLLWNIFVVRLFFMLLFELYSALRI